MGTPLWLTAIVAIVTPVVTLWGVYRTDRRQQASNQELIRRELRERRSAAYIDFSANILHCIFGQPADTMKRIKELHPDFVRLQVYGNDAARDIAKIVYMMTLDCLYDRLTSDMPHAEMRKRVEHIEVYCELLVLTVRYDLEVPKPSRSPRPPEANVEAALGSQDVNPGFTIHNRARSNFSEG